MKLLVTLILSIYSTISFSQNLTFEDFIGLRKKNLADIEESLSMKGWSLYTDENSTNDDLVIFAYRRNEYNKHADSFLSYYNYENNDSKRVHIQIRNKQIYSNYIARLKINGFKLIKNLLKDNKIEKVYQNTKTTVLIIVSDEINDSTLKPFTNYSLSAMSNHEYELNFSY